jgi:hypothetical protein
MPLVQQQSRVHRRVALHQNHAVRAVKSCKIGQQAQRADDVANDLVHSASSPLRTA